MIETCSGCSCPGSVSLDVYTGTQPYPVLTLAGARRMVGPTPPADRIRGPHRRGRDGIRSVMECGGAGERAATPPETDRSLPGPRGRPRWQGRTAANVSGPLPCLTPGIGSTDAWRPTPAVSDGQRTATCNEIYQEYQSSSPSCPQRGGTHR